MARATPTLQQGESQEELAKGSIEARARYTYGGSDNTAPSFNNPQYVRYGSVQRPRDFGSVDQLLVDVDGLVGSESGTSSLFFRFTTNKPARIGAQRVPQNRYTDQYVSIALRRTDGAIAPFDEYELAASALGSGESAQATLVGAVEVGYVVSDYWEPGYADSDSAQGVTTVDLGEPPVGVQLPAGDYLFVVSSSQWRALPYRFLLSVAPNKALSGVATLSAQVSARVSLVNLSGTAACEASASARLRSYLKLSGAASATAEPRATLRRTSPFS